MLQKNEVRTASKFVGGPLDGEILLILKNVTYIDFKVEEVSKDKCMYERVDSEFVYQGFIH